MAHMRLIEAQVDRRVDLTAHDHAMLVNYLDELRSSTTQSETVRLEAERLARKVRQATKQGWGKR
jgi:archaellum component FlaD/FlaE